MPLRLATALLCLTLAAPAAAVPDLVDGIAAQVGSDVVLLSEVTRITRPMEARMREAGAPPSEIARVRAEVLDRLIERRLIEQLVRRAEIDAPDHEVDAAIEEIARENGISLDELRESVEAQGLDFPSYREQIRGEIQRSKVLNGVIGARVSVDEAELRALYRQRFAEMPERGEEVHLRQILVPYAGGSREAVREARAAVEGALERVRAGEAFERVAAEVSAVNPEAGGDVGWLAAEEMASWMAPAVAGLEAGETSDPIRTAFGVSLLHLVERRAFSRPDFDQVEDVLYSEVYSRKLEQEYEDWIETLRGQTYIERKGLFADAVRLPVVPEEGDGGDAAIDLPEPGSP